MNKKISVYIHIPFCSSICTYCDFPKRLYFKKYISRYLDSLEHEIKEKYQNEEVKTLYIGGGTPSVLSVDELKRLFKIIEIFKRKKDIEFTIECNINDIDEEKVKLFKENSVNRISLGIQTFDEETLKKMNRKHDYELVKEKINIIKQCGIDNINADLIYAFPGTTISDLKEDLVKFFSLPIKHISTYSLIIEPNTILYINKVKNIPEELDRKMYDLICEETKKKGFIHYEVSNFSLPGYESKHNLTYWNNEEYYGFGLGASGYLGDLRYTNTLSFNKYLEDDYDAEKEVLDKNDKMIYELILGMRKISGVNIGNFNRKYQKNLLESPKIQELIKKGDLIVDENYLKIPYNKIYIQNGILEELLDYE